jgi:cyclic AMP-dependent transcription factor ATF-4
MEAADEDVKAFNHHQVESDDQFVMDFNSLLDSVDLANELTPPQTPPPEIFGLQPSIYQQQNIPGFEIYEISCENDNFSQSTSPSMSFYEGSNQSDDVVFDPESIISSPVDIQRELKVVDELVRAHSRHASDIEDSKSILSVSSASWSPRSGYASSSGYSQFDDFERNLNKRSSNLSGVTKKRPRAYRRNPEEKKYRKKEQNKNAATRYRQKKKQEIEVIMDEGKILEEKHKKLLVIYKDAKREVKCLKGLLRDLFKARGIIQ